MGGWCGGLLFVWVLFILVFRGCGLVSGLWLVVVCLFGVLGLLWCLYGFVLFWFCAFVVWCLIMCFFDCEGGVVLFCGRGVWCLVVCVCDLIFWILCGCVYYMGFVGYFGVYWLFDYLLVVFGVWVVVFVLCLLYSLFVVMWLCFSGFKLGLSWFEFRVGLFCLVAMLFGWVGGWLL